MKKIFNVLMILLILILHYRNGWIQKIHDVDSYMITNKTIIIHIKSIVLPIRINRDEILYWEERHE